jgi:myo-inositol-1(or 4)-monophosphatase
MRAAEKFIQTLVRKAGDAVLKRFGKDFHIHVKTDSPWDGVTKADLAAERMIIAEIKKHYPAHGIIAEESGSYNPEAEYVWIIDPIDGTLNFATGVPLFSTMVALVHRRKVVLSAIYMPVMNELFFAKAGGGAYLNGKRIHCSRRREFKNSLGCGFSSIRMRTAPFIKSLFSAIGKEHVVFNSFGAISVNACYVACGRRDWLMAPHGALHDFAPTYLILKEAGCAATDITGEPWKFGAQGIVAANSILHRQLLKASENL